MAKRLLEESENARLLKAGLTFGLSLGLQIYVLGFLLGAYLDRRLQMEAPYFVLGGTLIAIILSFYQLLRALSKPRAQQRQLEKDGKPRCRR